MVREWQGGRVVKLQSGKVAKWQSGKVAKISSGRFKKVQPCNPATLQQAALRPFIECVLADERVDALVVPLGKGELVVRKV